jgi:predicted TIM-barrel fold metal-dependent hydrolase
MNLSELRILDAHQHLWDLSRVQLQWHATPGFQPLSRNFLLEDYQAATKGLNVVNTIYMEVDALPSQHADEAEWVLGMCAQADSRIAGAVIGARLTEGGFSAYLHRFEADPHLKGVRDLLDEQRSPPGRCLRPELQQAVRRLGEAGLSFDIAIRPNELPDAAQLIAACSDTRFIIDHCGGMPIRAHDRSSWRQGLDDVAKSQNVYCKISGLCSSPHLGPWRAEELAPVVTDCFAAFGPDRVMFGSDWPVCTLGGTYRTWVEALLAVVADRPDSEQAALFHDNAVRCYRL